MNSGRRRRRIRRWYRNHWRDAAVMVGAVVAVVAIVLLVFRDTTPAVDREADRQRDEAMQQTHAEQRAERRAEARAFAHSLDVPGEPRVMFIGDSWTDGYGAPTRQLGYAYLTGERLGVDYYVQGIGGTGYTVDSKGQPASSYPDRAAALPVDGFVPNLVIIQGGGNDYESTDIETEAALRETIATVHQRLPDARVAVLPLMTPLGSERPYGICLWAQQAGAECIQSAEWITDDTMIDKTHHPDLDGHAVIARRLVAELRARGV